MASAITFDRVTAELRPPMLALLVLALFGLSLTAAWLYGFKRPLATLAETEQRLELLDEHRSAGDLADELATARADLAELVMRLGGDLEHLAPAQLVAFLMREFDLRANAHGVRLLSVTPSAPVPALGFLELPFVVEVRGDYFSLYDWVGDIESGIGVVSVKGLDVQRAGRDGERAMKLIMVAYRPLEGGAS